MRKALILSSVASMIDQFNIPNIELLLKNGYQVDVACNFENGNSCSGEKILRLKKQLKNMGVGYYQIDFERDIKKLLRNAKAYSQVLKLVKDNDYNFIHCHSPIGGVCARLAGRATGTKVIYTAHGFHFYKGAPIKNWLLYYPVERLLAHYTDVLITINKEDYNRAKKSFKAKSTVYIPGVGLDTAKFSEMIINKSNKRSEIGIPCDSFVVLSVGELNRNKNHETIIKAVAQLNNPNIYYAICGQGPLEEYLRGLAKKLGVEDKVRLLGFRNDVADIYKASDAFAFPSLREGLGMSALEAMASGLPLITSNIHGIVDYSIDGVTGYTCNPMDTDGFANAIMRLYKEIDKRRSMGSYNVRSVNKFDSSKVMYKMNQVYNEIEDTNKNERTANK